MLLLTYTSQAFRRGYGSPEGCRGPEPAAPSGRNRQAERRESQGAMVHRDYASSPRHPSIPPSSFWAQRSAQPAGIHKRILLKCVRIVIVAYRLLSDSCLGALRAWVTLGCRPDLPEGFHPSDSLLRFALVLRFSVRLISLNPPHSSHQ